MKVFFAVSESVADEVCDCGIKMSEYADRCVLIAGAERKCIAAALTPGDIVCAADTAVEVLRLNPDDSHGWIAEGAFYEEYILNREKSEEVYFWKSEYEKSLMPVKDYKLGMYKKPEYLIYRTLFPDVIERFDRRRGEPILYNNSNELYIGKAIRFAEEKCDDFYELAVKAFADRWAVENSMTVKKGEKYTMYIDGDGTVKYVSSCI
ncbi:MAG: hypothetical protein IJZ90_00460 [Clostridia bacterium]|nr:hypothetical protein [Clostridia bacterium]